jgi:hypothetical protein
MYDDEFSASSELFDIDLKTRILGVVPTVFLNNQEVTKNQYESLETSIKIRPATAIPYTSNRDSSRSDKSKLKTNFLVDTDDKKEFKDTDSIITEETRISKAERRRNYLDYITNSILSKKAFDFVSTESKEKIFSRPVSGVSRMSFTSIKTTDTKFSNKNSRPNSSMKNENTNSMYSSKNQKFNRLKITKESNIDSYNDIINSTYNFFPFPIKEKKIITKKKSDKTDVLEESRMQFLNELTPTTSLINDSKENSVKITEETKGEDLDKSSQGIQSSIDSFDSFNVPESEVTSSISKKKKKISNRIKAKSAKAKLQNIRTSILSINEPTQLNRYSMVIINF